MAVQTKQPSLKRTLNLAASVIIVLAICVFLALLGRRHYIRWDLTSSGEFTLSDKTIQVLKTVDKPIHIKAFVRKGFKEEEAADKILSAYQYNCDKIGYEFFDPERQPSMALRYGIKDINTFVLEGYGRVQKIKIIDEEHITDAIIRLIKGDIQHVYWITGHGERPFMGFSTSTLSKFVETLSRENYKFANLNLMERGVPTDASLVVIASPLKPLFPEEIQSLKKYLLSGGRILIFLEPFHDAGLKQFLREFGIIIRNDVVVDKLSRVMGGDYLLPMVANYGDHEITRGFNLTSLFYIARSIDPSPDELKHIIVTGLAYTSAHAWSETNRNVLEGGQVQFDEGQDTRGPLCLTVISELTPPISQSQPSGKKASSSSNITGKGKIVVFGDVDFASNRYFSMAGNSDLILNTVNYLTSRESFVTIRKKHRPIEALMLTRTQGLIVFWIPVVVIPLIILLLGIWSWKTRRPK